MQNNNNYKKSIPINKESIHWNKHRMMRKYILNLIGLYENQLFYLLNNQTKSSFNYKYKFKKGDFRCMFQTHLMIRDFFTSWDNRDKFQEIIDVLEFLFKTPFLFFKTIDVYQLPLVFQQGFLFEFIHWIAKICDFIRINNNVNLLNVVDVINYFAPKSIRIKKGYQY